jgi:hypothetical protein
MAPIRSLIAALRAEPVLLSALATVLVTIAARFGLDLTTDQVLAVFAALASATGLVARSQVTPTGGTK